MTFLRNILHPIKQRLGDLWWYTLILFVALRLGDIVNAVIGIWLVPQYVPQSELGAVLPLMSVGGLLGFPLVALTIPFMKFLNKYTALGEFGKVKQLLRDTFIFTGILFVVVSLAARFLLPLVFNRMRVEDGSLSLLIVVSGIVAALTPVFTTALQSLKKFIVFSASASLSALVRLVTMLVCLPIRGLSGYFVGQIIPNLFIIGCAFIALLKQFSRKIKMTPYWSDDWKPILRYAKWPVLLHFAGMSLVTIESFVIRRCLPDIESAGFYMISRFAEITLYFGFACATILFPLVSERYEKGQLGQQKLLVQSVLFTLVVGLCFSGIIVPCTHLLFTFKTDWNVYTRFTPHLVALSLIYVIRGAVHCFVTYQIARNQFRFVPFFVFMYCSEMVVLYCLTGYTFFTPWMPDTWLSTLDAFNPCRLSVVLGIMFLYVLPIFIYSLVSTKRALKNVDSIPLHGMSETKHAHEK